MLATTGKKIVIHILQFAFALLWRTSTIHMRRCSDFWPHCCVYLLKIPMGLFVCKLLLACLLAQFLPSFLEQRWQSSIQDDDGHWSLQAPSFVGGVFKSPWIAVASWRWETYAPPDPILLCCCWCCCQVLQTTRLYGLQQIQPAIITSWRLVCQ